MPRVVPPEIVQALRQYSEDEIKYVFDLNGVKYKNADLEVRFREGGILNIFTKNDRRNMVHIENDGTQLRQNGIIRIIRGIAVDENPHSVWVFIATATSSFEIFATSPRVKQSVIYQRSTAQDWRVFQNLGAAAGDGSLWTILNGNDAPLPNAPQIFCAFRDGALHIISQVIGYRAKLSLRGRELRAEVKINGIPQMISGFSAEALEREGTPALVIIRTNDYTLQVVAVSLISF